MVAYRVKPLKYGEAVVPKGAITYMVDMGLYITGPLYVFLIEGGGKRILVDTGCVLPDPNGTYHGFPLKGGGPSPVEEVLAKEGLRPKDIEIVILSHLHFDHCGNIKLFKHAKFFLQKEEWESAHNPIPTQRGLYPKEAFEILEDYDTEFVDGDVEIMEGLTLIKTPGHTMGLSAIALNTVRGTMVLCSDHAYTYMNLNPAISSFIDLEGQRVEVTPVPDLKYLPVGIHVNLTDWFHSMEKLARIASSPELLIPGHDFSLWGKSLPDDLECFSKPYPKG